DGGRHLRRIEKMPVK
ncbi:hypothetical protein, partial [uncultured Duncaniella sp.]